jgi:hypothetical protein
MLDIRLHLLLLHFASGLQRAAVAGDRVGMLSKANVKLMSQMETMILKINP